VYTFLFIPNAFLVRDFTLISANAKNSIFLKKYVYEYWKYSGLVLLFIIPSFFLFSDKILILLFGDKFQNSLSIQNILICGLASMVLLRMLFGNILNAVGKAKLNVINAVVTIILALPLLFWLTKYYGILGTAYGMLGMFFVSGLISLGMFLYYLRTISAIGGFHETAHHR
jgi:O-antigen/teichoic acid export membrane protein